MVDFETIKVMDKLNRLAKMTKDAKYISVNGVQPAEIDAGTMIRIFAGVAVYYATSKLMRVDKCFMYYPLLEVVDGRGVIYSKDCVVAVPNEEAKKNGDEPFVILYPKGMLVDKESIIISDGEWYTVELE